MQEFLSGERKQGMEITCSDDVTEAYLMLLPKGGDEVYNVDELERYLREMGIKCGIQRSSLQHMVDTAQFGVPVKVAEGKKPVNGKDGWYEFCFPTDVDRKPKILKDGSVDYTAYGNIPSVEEGAVLAVYHAATQAVDGENVYGEVIPAIRGKELAKLRGKGFYAAEDGCTFLAKYDGKATYVDERLTVDRELVIDGDASNATGDIIFLNDVYIRGNVLAGVTVKSDKGSIIVDGYVESAVLIAKKDIVLKNGMQGNNRGKIIAGGNVSGKFFEQVTVEAGGDVNANAIMNSHIEAGQDVTVSGRFGIIIGGIVHAMRQVNATIIGNMAEVSTKVHVGVEGDLFVLLDQCEREEAAAEGELERIVRALSQLEQLIEKNGREDLQSKKLLLMRGKIEKDTRVNELMKKKQGIIEQMGKVNQAKVTIEKMVYPGTVIMINGVKVLVTNVTPHVEYARRGTGIIVYNIGD